MANEYNIPEMIVMAQDLGYKPFLAAAVNKLLRTRIKEDYIIAEKEALAIITGYDLDPDEFNSQRDYWSDDPDRFEGLPVFQPLKLTVGNKTMQIDAVVVNVNRQKNIVTTQVQGRDSSVKEMINNGDWACSFSGILSNNIWEWPYDKVVKLANIMAEKANIQVKHEVLNALGIYEIVVTDFSLEKTPYINCQPFSFEALSDHPLPLIVEDLPTILSS